MQKKRNQAGKKEEQVANHKLVVHPKGSEEIKKFIDQVRKNRTLLQKQVTWQQNQRNVEKSQPPGICRETQKGGGEVSQGRRKWGTGLSGFQK